MTREILALIALLATPIEMLRLDSLTRRGAITSLSLFASGLPHSTWRSWAEAPPQRPTRTAQQAILDAAGVSMPKAESAASEEALPVLTPGEVKFRSFFTDYIAKKEVNLGFPLDDSDKAEFETIQRNKYWYARPTSWRTSFLTHHLTMFAFMSTAASRGCTAA